VRELSRQRAGAVAEGARDVARPSERCVQAYEEKPDSDPRRTCQGEVPPGERHPAQPQPEEQVARSEHEHSAAVGSEPARPDHDQDADGDERKQSHAQERRAEQSRDEEQGLDLVRDSVEADAAVGMGAECGQRARLGREGEHARVDGEDDQQRRREREPRAGQRGEGRSAEADHREQRQTDRARPRDLERAQRERTHERDGTGEERRSSPEGGPEPEREQGEQRAKAEDDVRRGAA
jgi:hypothetical protein